MFIGGWFNASQYLDLDNRWEFNLEGLRRKAQQAIKKFILLARVIDKMFAITLYQSKTKTCSLVAQS